MLRKHIFTKKTLQKTIVLVTVLLAFSLTGCGSSDNNHNTQTNDETSTASQQLQTTSVSASTESLTSTTVSNSSNQKYSTDFSVPNEVNQKKEGRNYGEVTEISYYSTTTNCERKASVVLPYNYSTEKKYPVLYLLHGMGGDHTSWIQFGAMEIVTNAAYDHNKGDMIIVVPHVFTSDDGSTEGSLQFGRLTDYYDKFGDDLMSSLMPYINNNYSTKTDRASTAIGGYSLGGRESLYIGYKYPEHFGNIAGLSPVGGVVNGVSRGYSSSTGSSYLLETFDLPASIGQPEYILLTVGTTDPYCLTSTINYHNYMTSHNIYHQYYTAEGGHDGGIWIMGLYNFASRIF